MPATPAALLGSEGVGAVPFTTTLLTPWLGAMMAALPPDPVSEDSNAAMQVVGLENMFAASYLDGLSTAATSGVRTKTLRVRSSASPAWPTTSRRPPAGAGRFPAKEHRILGDRYA